MDRCVRSEAAQGTASAVATAYITSDATTETALFCGEVYRHGDEWKIRPVGQGLDSGLACLATDFSVNVDEDFDHERVDETVRHEAGDRYRLWTQARTFCEYELTIEPPFLPALRSPFPQDFLTDGDELRPIVELVPEPGGDRGEWAVSVRAGGRTVAYLNDEDAPRWASPTTRSRTCRSATTPNGRTSPPAVNTCNWPPRGLPSPDTVVLPTSAS